MNSLEAQKRASCTPKERKINIIILIAFLLSLPITRQIGGANLLAFIAVTALISAKTWSPGKIPSGLVALSTISLIYATLSAVQLLPPAWTKIHSIDAIPQQALYAYFIIPAFFFQRTLFEKYISLPKGRRDLALILLLTWISIKLIAYTNGEITSILKVIAIEGMGNYSSIVIAATCLYLSTVKSATKKIVILTAFLALSFLSEFSQNKVYALVFIAIWLLPKQSTAITALFSTACVAFYSVTIRDPLSVQFIDQNLTVRLVLIKDAFDGFIQSWLIGVGFGTESIQNYYSIFDNPVFADENAPGFINLAVHNSFATTLFRIGIIGFASLLYFTVQSFIASKSIISTQEKAASMSLLTACFVVTFQNPGLESYIYLNGICIYLSLAWALSESSERVKSRKTTHKSNKKNENPAGA